MFSVEDCKRLVLTNPEWNTFLEFDVVAVDGRQGQQLADSLEKGEDYTNNLRKDDLC
jgi:hypothetical protein